jgi:hypothetical protein
VSGKIDLKNYIPQIDKSMDFSVTDENMNGNANVTYTSLNGVTTLKSTHKGLDLDDYVGFDKFINLDSTYREAQSSIEFSSTYLSYIRDQEKSSIPRFYESNTSRDFPVTENLSFRIHSNTYNNAVTTESNSSSCSIS